VVGNAKATFLRNFMLALLDFFVIEFLDPSAIEANQVIVMRTGIEFKYGFAGLKMITMQQSRLLKLRQYAVYSCQSNI